MRSSFSPQDQLSQLAPVPHSCTLSLLRSAAACGKLAKQSKVALKAYNVKGDVAVLLGATPQLVLHWHGALRSKRLSGGAVEGRQKGLRMAGLGLTALHLFFSSGVQLRPLP